MSTQEYWIHYEATFGDLTVPRLEGPLPQKQAVDRGLELRKDPWYSNIMLEPRRHQPSTEGQPDVGETNTNDDAPDLDDLSIRSIALREAVALVGQGMRANLVETMDETPDDAVLRIAQQFEAYLRTGS